MVALPLLLPLATFALLALVWPLRRRGRVAGVLSALSAAGAFVAAVALLGAEPTTLRVPWLVHDGAPFAWLGWRLDGVSSLMLVVVTAVSTCVQVYSLGYLHDEPAPSLGRYFAWQSLFLFSMVGLVLAPDLLQLFACWELVGLCSYLLIGFWWSKPAAARAAVKAFWITKFADMGLLLALVVLFGATGAFSWETPLTPGVAAAVAGLLLVGVMGKSAQVPLHVWLPDAMEGPTPVSALLHAATMVAAGIFLVVRAYPIFAAAPDVLALMAWIGAVTAVVGAGAAVAQTDIKRLLAYSTCSQLGFMLAGLGSGSALGAYFHLGTHAFFKALLFLGAGAAIHAVHGNELAAMGGLRRTMPATAALFAVGALALAGLPGLSGFFSKDLLLEELWHAGHAGPTALLLGAAGVTAFYMAKVVRLAFLGPPSVAAGRAREAPATMLLPMAFLAVPAALAGYGGAAFAGKLGAGWHFAFTEVGAVATAMAVGGLILGLARPDLAPAGLVALVRAAPVDGAWRAAWRRGLEPASRAVAWVDRHVVDGLPNLVAWAVLHGGARLRAVQTGRVRDYAYAVAVGALAFAGWGVVAG